MDAAALGPASRVLFEQLLESLPPDGRDARLLLRAHLLTPASAKALYEQRPPGTPTYTAGSRPDLETRARAIARDARPGLGTTAALVDGVSKLEARERADSDRTEEAILGSGGATVLERVRALAALAQASGLDARICVLLNERDAAVHAVCEIGIMNGWTVFDPLAARYYLYPHRGYASALDILRRPEILDNHPDHGRLPTVDSTYYRDIAIADLESQA
jgi:hypothetical protein